MPSIFISYRRQDSAGISGRIYDRLRAHFGDGAVFMDIDAIPFGEDFRKHIDQAVSQCDVVLAVIGAKWVGDADVRRRLDEPRDFVRIELESALRREIPVIPILIDSTPMPAGADLPSSLAELVFRNAIEVDQGRDFHPHVDRLIRGIEFHFKRAKTGAAPRPSEPAKAAVPPPIPAAPARPAKVVPTEPGQQPKAKPEGADALKPKAEAIPVGSLEPGPRSQPKPVVAEPIRLLSAELSTARPKSPAIPRFLLYVGALPMLALLGVVLYTITHSGAVETTGKVSNTGAPQPASDVPQKPETASAGAVTSSVPITTKPGDPKSSSAELGREWKNSIGMKLVRIEPGGFQMGTTKSQVDQLIGFFPDAKREYFDGEQPQHSVRISRAYYLGIHEVTQGQYQAVTGQNPSNFKGADDLPVENVSWIDAVQFCNKLSARENRPLYYRIDGTTVTIVGGTGYRLPTEAEWEYACRAGSSAIYPFGDEPSQLDRYAWYDKNAGSKTHPVGRLLANAWGLYDMLGNVYEWCGDGYDEKYYASPPPVDPPGASGASHRVFRGGGWLVHPGYCRPAYRLRLSPADRNRHLGFRVAAVQD